MENVISIIIVVIVIGLIGVLMIFSILSEIYEPPKKDLAKTTPQENDALAERALQLERQKIERIQLELKNKCYNKIKKAVIAHFSSSWVLTKDCLDALIDRYYCICLNRKACYQDIKEISINLSVDLSMSFDSNRGFYYLINNI